MNQREPQTWHSHHREQSLSRGQSVWPFLRAVEDAKNADRCFGNCIYRDLRRAVNDQFAGAGNSANTTARGEIYQSANGSDDPLVNQNGR